MNERLGRASETLKSPPPAPYLKWGGYILFHLVFFPFLTLYTLIRAKRRGFRKGIWRRLVGGDRPPAHHPRLIFLARGLGEVRTAARVAADFRTERGISSAILTGADDAMVVDTAETFLGRFPFNNPISALVFLLRWRPATIVAFEFQEGHHLKMLARMLGVQQLIVNVPITDAELDRLLNRPGSLWRWLPVDLYHCASDAVRDRLRRLGVAEDRILVAPPWGLVPLRGDGLSREELGIPRDAFVLLAGSTYPPEEEALLTAFDRLRRLRPDAILILAPRLLRRPGGPESTLKGRAFARRSARESPAASGILLLDTIGELKGVHAAADLAYVGGTFGVNVGGHTAMEAIAWHVPVLVGPLHRQHVATVEDLTNEGAAFRFDTLDELSELLMHLARDEGRLDSARAAAARAAQRSEDSTLAIYDALIAPTMMGQSVQRLLF